MALDAAQLAALRAEVGSEPDDATLQAIFDRTLNLGAVAIEVQSTRLADMMNTPATFTIVGDYSQSNETNIAALKKQLDRLRGLAGSDSAGLFGDNSVRLIQPEYGSR